MMRKLTVVGRRVPDERRGNVGYFISEHVHESDVIVFVLDDLCPHECVLQTEHVVRFQSHPHCFFDGRLRYLPMATVASLFFNEKESDPIKIIEIYVFKIKKVT